MCYWPFYLRLACDRTHGEERSEDFFIFIAHDPLPRFGLKLQLLPWKASRIDMNKPREKGKGWQSTCDISGVAALQGCPGNYLYDQVIHFLSATKITLSNCVRVKIKLSTKFF